jgi:hypothetical protein
MTCLYHSRIDLGRGPHAYLTRTPEGGVQLVFTTPPPLDLGATELIRRDFAKQTGLKAYLVEALRPAASFDAMVRAYERTADARIAAGWDQCPETGAWCSPEGVSESDWDAEGYPLPEDPAFREWASAFYHYDAADAGVPDPFPPTPAA